MCDNMPVTIAMERLTRNFKLLVQIRRHTSFCLFSYIKFYTHWINSEVRQRQRRSQLSF